MFQDRQYQQEAIRLGIDFFVSKRIENKIIVMPPGAGKSICIAGIANGLPLKPDGTKRRGLILQPNKEILAQNFQKYVSYGNHAGVYSVSAGLSIMGQVTFAMIGSIVNKLWILNDVDWIIVDECDLCNAQEGTMYQKLIEYLGHCKVLGLTATPYRLASDRYGAMLKFITRTRPKIFNKILYNVDPEVLFSQGYLAPLEYYPYEVVERAQLVVNSNGTDFTQESLKKLYAKINYPKITIDYGKRILAKRNNLLIFSANLEHAAAVCKGIPGSVIVSSETPQVQRDRIISQFRANKIRCMINVNIAGVGFDKPDLEAVLLAFSTMSLRRYYQNVGRVMRPHTYEDGTKKKGWVIDIGGNFRKFGKIEDMQMMVDERGQYAVFNKGRQLTNCVFQK